MMARHSNAPRPARRAPLTEVEARRRAQAVREAQRAERASLAPAAPMEAPPVTLLVRPDVVIRPASTVATSPGAAAGARRVTASITMTLIDRRDRSAADVICAAMEALQNAQAAGATDDMTGEALDEHFAVERLALSAIMAEGEA